MKTQNFEKEADVNTTEELTLYFNHFLKKEKCFQQPTPVQNQCWPLILASQDVLGIAPTGSGKTLAYLLPVIYRVLKIKKMKFKVDPCHPLALIIVPTRDLALQVYQTCTRSSKWLELITKVAYGGKNRENQIKELSTEKGIDILIVTPGRALDLFRIEAVLSQDISILVLDEADKMLDLGFEPDIQNLLSLIHKSQISKEQNIFDKNAKQQNFSKTQYIMLSATFPDKLHKIVSQFSLLGSCSSSFIIDSQGKICKMNQDDSLSNVENFGLKNNDINQNYFSVINSNIKQIVQLCANHKKPRKLLRLIHKIHIDDIAAKRRNRSSILIFCSKIKTVVFVYKLLNQRHKIKSVALLHGSLSQNLREKILADFKAGRINILISTDVVSRGIDIKCLPYVINYDFPSSLTDYIHRIGRTGRHSSLGTAISFVTRNMAPLFPDLIDLLTLCKQKVDPYIQQISSQIMTGNLLVQHDNC